MRSVIVFGKASNKVIKEIEVIETDLMRPLIDILQQAGIPVANSCNSEGICKKCNFNGELLSC